MEEEKRKYLSETIGLPLKMVLVHTEDLSSQQETCSPARPGQAEEQGEKEAAVLRLIQHLNKKA
jgi:hypothetical protein